MLLAWWRNEGMPSRCVTLLCSWCVPDLKKSRAQARGSTLAVPHGELLPLGAATHITLTRHAAGLSQRESRMSLGRLLFAERRACSHHCFVSFVPSW